MRVERFASLPGARWLTLLAPLFVVMMGGGCKKEEKDYATEDELVRLEAFQQVHYPDATVHDDRSFSLLLYKSGGSEIVERGNWLFFDFLACDLDGFFVGTTIRQQAKDHGAYRSSARYTPRYKEVSEASMGAGLANALEGVRVGDTLLVGLPSSLANQTDLWSAYANRSMLCRVIPRERVVSPTEYEKNQIEAFLAKNGGFSPFDSVYREVLKVGDGVEVTKGSTVWVEYTGYYLDGGVFDTNSEAQAQAHGIHSSNRYYLPLSMKAQNDGKMIRGLSGVMVGQKVGAKLRVLIPSGLGYGVNGKGAIRPYEPLLFELTIVRAI